jgi:hypothetical protein
MERPRETLSLMEWLALGSDSERREILGQLTDGQAMALLWDLQTWARPSQLPPNDPDWLILAGRNTPKVHPGGGARDISGGLLLSCPVEPIEPGAVGGEAHDRTNRSGIRKGGQIR